MDKLKAEIVEELNRLMAEESEAFLRYFQLRYRLRGTEITQMTEDHSLINDYIRMKRVTPEEAENWPHKNVIVRALGMKESVQVDIITEVPRVGIPSITIAK